MAGRDMTYRRIQAENLETGEMMDLIVDPSKRIAASGENNVYSPQKDVAYGRPQHGRLPLGYYGENLVSTDDPVDYIHVWHVVDIDAPKPLAQIANPLLQADHPVRFAVISGVWAKQAD
jgi:hypothetical protein